MDFVRRLVQINYIGEAAVNIVQSKRDPPNHGVRLQPAGQAQAQADPGPAQQAAVATEWVWDVQSNKYRRWDGAAWVWQ